MLIRSGLIALAASVALAGLAQAETVTAAINTADGKPAGQIILTAAPTGVLLHVEALGLAPGWHAMHFHEKGDCSDPKLANAGAHMNMAGAGKRTHGLLAAGGPDFGDLTNLYVGADGKGQAEAFSTLVSLHGEGGRPALIDNDGSALIIHASPDDYTTQPIGGAGARAACAVIR